MKILLELLRIVFIFFFLGGIMATVLTNVYAMTGINVDDYNWMGVLGILILLFVLYRNRWQFSGWYSGKGSEKLPVKTSNLLLTISILMLMLPPVLGLIL
ncbi:hypothetical protein CU633_21355 [Bacillus sp. V3-13]|uniref:hypothetical protein n=1 Tax=Bacillus sp. V3-13 TaxID=2053728 RepID=UPI000C76883B|nr:hypothetical protein [Bacillus sp. V3-13]PLR75378.1 hypothetical protein CU633_21355 [Bacillus sp. V3-13]